MSAEFVSRLRRFDTCTISDAMDRLGLAGVASGLARASGGGRIAGRVVTLKVGVGVPAAGAPRHLGTAAIESAGADDVIVVEQHSGIEAGCWGGLLTLGASVRGVAGVIADGPVRDIDEARGLGFAIYAARFTARTARGRVVELGTNVPITCRGVRVEAADYVVADDSAVVFIPAAQIAATLDAADAIATREAAMARAIAGGTPISAVMDGSYEHLLKKG
jgi:4-hydroxy-4-methyl-2-oxoglutarate aldolase